MARKVPSETSPPVRETARMVTKLPPADWNEALVTAVICFQLGLVLSSLKRGARELGA